MIGSFAQGGGGKDINNKVPRNQVEFKIFVFYLPFHF